MLLMTKKQLSSVRELASVLYGLHNPQAALPAGIMQYLNPYLEEKPDGAVYLRSAYQRQILDVSAQGNNLTQSLL